MKSKQLHARLFINFPLFFTFKEEEIKIHSPHVERNRDRFNKTRLAAKF